MTAITRANAYLPIRHENPSPITVPMVKVITSWVECAKLLPVDRRTYTGRSGGRTASGETRNKAVEHHINVALLWGKSALQRTIPEQIRNNQAKTCSPNPVHCHTHTSHHGTLVFSSLPT